MCTCVWWLKHTRNTDHRMWLKRCLLIWENHIKNHKTKFQTWLSGCKSHFKDCNTKYERKVFPNLNKNTKIPKRLTSKVLPDCKVNLHAMDRWPKPSSNASLPQSCPRAGLPDCCEPSRKLAIIWKICKNNFYVSNSSNRLKLQHIIFVILIFK